MKEVTIHIKEKKYNFFMELLKSLDFVKLEENEIEGDSPEEIHANLKQAFKELKLYKEGKLQFRDAKDLIDEL